MEEKLTKEQTGKNRVLESMVTKFVSEKSQPLVTKLENNLPFYLSWSHYLILMRIENSEERNFYEKQALKEGWGKENYNVNMEVHYMKGY